MLITIGLGLVGLIIDVPVSHIAVSTQAGQWRRTGGAISLGLRLWVQGLMESPFNVRDDTTSHIPPD
jgi:hypothetical protein